MNRRNFLKGFLATATVVALAPLAPVVELPTAEATYLTFDEVLKTTLDNYRQVMIDHITKPSPIFLKMKEIGWIKEEGMNIVEPVIYA